MNRKYILVVIVSLIVVLSISLTYALFYSSISQSDLNTLNTSCFDVSFIENSSSINLENTYPMSSDKGLKQTPYSFTITNTCNITSEYLVTFSTTNNSSSTILPYMNISFDGNNFSKLNTLNTTTLANDLITLYTLKTTYEIDTGYLDQNDSKTFNITLWLDESAPNSVMGESFEGRVLVTNNAIMLIQ